MLGFSGYLVFVSSCFPFLPHVTNQSSLRVSLSVSRTTKSRLLYLFLWFCELVESTYGDSLSGVIFSYGLMQSFGNMVRGIRVSIHVLMELQGPGDMLGLTSSE